MRRISASAEAESGGPCLSERSETNPAGDLATSRPPMAAQALAKILERPGVEHIFRLDPRASRHLHAPTQAIERGDRMGIGGDDQRDATFTGQSCVRVAEIETLGLAVDLHGHA